ncbi:MAG: hypothetical protein RTV72_06935 [Candidatus Thorarchaeota archaeon]
MKLSKDSIRFWYERNHPYIKMWGTASYLFSIFTFFTVSILTTNQTLRLLSVVLALIVTTILTMAILYDIVPKHISGLLWRYLPITFGVGVIIPLSALFVLGTPTLLSYLGTVGVDYPEALGLSIGLTVLVSLMVMIKGIASWKSMHLDELQHPLSHHLVTMQLGTSQPIFTEIRRDFVEDKSPLLRIKNETKRIENGIEITTGTSVMIIGLILYLRVFELSAPVGTEFYDMILFSAAMFLLIPPRQYAEYLINYRKWRHSWIEYWTFAKNMVIPDSILTDTLNPLKTPLRINIKHYSRTERQKEYAKEIANTYGFDDVDLSEILWIEILFWYDDIVHRLKLLSKEKFDEYPSLRKFRDLFYAKEKGGDPDEFLPIIRASKVLDLLNVAKYMPEVFHSISDWDTWIQSYDKIENRSGLLETAIGELRYFRDLGVFPIPTSVTWLLAFFALAVSILPYALVVGFTTFLP